MAKRFAYIYFYAAAIPQSNSNADFEDVKLDLAVVSDYTCEPNHKFTTSKIVNKSWRNI